MSSNWKLRSTLRKTQMEFGGDRVGIQNERNQADMGGGNQDGESQEHLSGGSRIRRSCQTESAQG